MYKLCTKLNILEIAPNWVCYLIEYMEIELSIRLMNDASFLQQVRLYSSTFYFTAPVDIHYTELVNGTN